ncbi:MAG: DUF86 domain-containing protein [Armatimonadota bacterium]|nr:DUF86 domain-containing protein [Armatimonadota bacterium]
MWKDDAWLLDILLAARRALDFTKNTDEQEFFQNELMQNAVMRQLEIMGEAARKISAETTNAHPDIPWRSLVGMRNRLIHEYFRIRLDRVWETVCDDIPELIKLIEPLVPPEDS